jgi:hypothetical protein
MKCEEMSDKIEEIFDKMEDNGSGGLF